MKLWYCTPVVQDTFSGLFIVICCQDGGLSCEKAEPESSSVTRIQTNHSEINQWVDSGGHDELIFQRCRQPRLTEEETWPQTKRWRHVGLTDTPFQTLYSYDQNYSNSWQIWILKTLIQPNVCFWNETRIVQKIKWCKTGDCFKRNVLFY